MRMRRKLKMKINRLVIEDNPAREVTSSRLFEKSVVQRNGEFAFDENGIFSYKIFPRYVNHTVNTDYGYIDFGELCIPRYSLTNKSELFRDLLHYNGFIYEGEYVKLDLSSDLTKYDTSKMLIGKEACLAVFGMTEEEYNLNVQSKICVIHPKYRPPIKDKVTGKYHLSKINQAYIDIIRLKNRYDFYCAEIQERDIWFELAVKNHIISHLEIIYNQLISLMQDGKRSKVQLELKGHPVDGMCRAVITNNFSLDEDVVLIGSYFIKYLYPNLYNKYTVLGITDIDAVNSELLEGEYYCLLNRMPTIGAGSTIGMIPQFSDKDKDRYVFQLNPIILTSLSGDVDGDSLSIVALYTREACKEAKQLLASKNYRTNIDGTVINGIFEDLLYSLNRLVENKDTDEVENLLNS